MYMATGDPVTDAERYQQYLEEMYPVKEGAVRMTLDVWVSVKGRTEEELREAAYQDVKDMMSSGSVSEWEYEIKEVEFE